MMAQGAATIRDRLGLSRFWRGERTERGTVRLASRRVYILPTREGFAYAFTVAIILVGSLNYQSSLGYMLSFTLASIGLVSMLWTQRNLVGLTVEIDDAPSVFAGEEALFAAVLATGDGRPRHSVVLVCEGGFRAVLDVSEGQDGTELRRGGLTRGVRTPGLVTVETRYPLGLFRAWSPIESGARVLVYPRPVFADAGRMEFKPDETPGHAASGAKKGGAEEFYGLREYAKGDLMSRVHWKSLARAGTLAVKEFELPEAYVYNLDYDALGGLDPEAKLSILCGQVLEADRAGAGYALTLPGVAVGPAKGRAHLTACLEALARFAP